MDILTSLFGVFASMISYIIVDYGFKFFFKKRTSLKESYNLKLKQLTSNLETASKEVDKIIIELTNHIESKEKHLNTLENELNKMSSKEIELKQKIEALQKTPIIVADHFAKLVEQGENRSKRRDYLLFGAGVLVTTIISLLLKI
jgi:septal ring factor EnvC (AmiA/AmiB activator)